MLGHGHLASSNQTANPGGYGDRQRERDLESHGRDGRKKALGGEVVGTELACHDDNDFEGEPLRLHHDHVGNGDAYHGAPVLQSTPAEATPALRAVDENDVENEDHGEKGSGADDGNRRANEAQAVHQKPHEENVNRRGDDQHIRRAVEEALGLEEALPRLEHDIPRNGRDEDLQVEAGKARRLGLGDDVRHDVFREDPEHHDGDGQAQEEKDHTLAVDADEVPVAVAVRLGAEGVEARGEALEYGKTRNGSRDVGHWVRSATTVRFVAEWTGRYSRETAPSSIVPSRPAATTLHKSTEYWSRNVNTSGAEENTTFRVSSAHGRGTSPGLASSGCSGAGLDAAVVSATGCRNKRGDLSVGPSWPGQSSPTRLPLPMEL